MIRKGIFWCGSSKKELKSLPHEIRYTAAYNLLRLQEGRDPLDFSPMPEIGPGAMEFRVDEGGGAYRVFYVSKFEEAIYVLHCFMKKSKRGKATPKQNIELAQARYAEVVRNRPALKSQR